MLANARSELYVPIVWALQHPNVFMQPFEAFGLTRFECIHLKGKLNSVYNQKAREEQYDTLFN